MQTHSDDSVTLWIVGTLVSLGLTGATYLWPNIQTEIRVLLILASFVPVLAVSLLQALLKEGFRAWLDAIRAFFIIYYPLVLWALVSFFSLVAFFTFQDTPLLLASRLVALAFFTASTSALLVARLRAPSVRIIKSVSSDEVYLVVDGVKKWIPDPLTYQFLALDTLRTVETVSDSELKLLRTGKTLPSISSCDLVKATGTEVYVIWEGKRKQFSDDATQKHFFPEKPPQEMSAGSLEGYHRSSTLYRIGPLK